MARSGIVALVALLAASMAVSGALGASEFVRVEGSKFVTDSCDDFAFGGYNSFQVIEAAADICCGGLTDLRSQFDKAADAGFSVVRMFGFSVIQGLNNQLAASVDAADVVYNESLLVAFDTALAEMAARNLKAIVVLANNWDYNGNMSDNKCWYANQTEGATSCDDFFTNPTTIKYYLANAQNIMNRVNTVTKVAYNADPTIMGWDLINEGRCEYPGCTAAGIQSWYATVAPIVKSFSPSQLVTTGMDGFYQADNCAADVINPVPNADGWPLRTGQDFLPNHAVEGVDFAGIHMWPDNWDRTDLDFGKAWVNSHNQQAGILGKPLILEEFGKAVGGTQGEGQTVQQQTEYYKLAYAITEAAINSGDNLRGILFWRWDAIDATSNAFDTESTLSSTSAAYTDVIQPFSQRMIKRCPSLAPTRGGATPGAGSTTSSAGRRLMQTGTPAAPAPTTTTPSVPAGTTSPAAASINAQATGAACQVDTSVGSIA